MFVDILGIEKGSLVRIFRIGGIVCYGGKFYDFKRFIKSENIFLIGKYLV